MSLERDSHAQEETGTYVTDPLSNTARAPPCLASLSEVCTLGPKCTQMARWNSVLRCFGASVLWVGIWGLGSGACIGVCLCGFATYLLGH